MDPNILNQSGRLRSGHLQEAFQPGTELVALSWAPEPSVALRLSASLRPLVVVFFAVRLLSTA